MASGGHNFNMVIRRFSVQFLVLVVLFCFSRSLARSHATPRPPPARRARARTLARTLGSLVGAPVDRLLIVWWSFVGQIWLLIAIF